MSEQHRSPTEPPNDAESISAAESVAAAGPASAAGPAEDAEKDAEGPETLVASGMSRASETSEALDAPNPSAESTTPAVESKTSGSASEPEDEEPAEFTLAALTNAISADFRRAVMAAVVACAGLGLTYASGGVFNSATAPIHYFHQHAWLGNTTAWTGAAAFLLFGLTAVRSATKEILKTVPDRMGDGRKNGLRWICLLVGYLLVIFGTLGALNVPIERLLLGGAVTGVILGIAAQQSLGNLFAGLVLLVVRPITIGQFISVRSGALGGVLTGEVADMNLTYVRLSTDKGEILLPNSSVLTAAIGPPHIFDL